MKVEFVYTIDVTTPRHLAGNIGDTRKLKEIEANLLKSQGFGYLQADGPPMKPIAKDGTSKKPKVKPKKPIVEPVAHDEPITEMDNEPIAEPLIDESTPAPKRYRKKKTE